MKPERAFRVGETHPSGLEYWQGETTWYIPGMAAGKASPGLPDGISLQELSIEEVNAAILLGVVDVRYIDPEVARSANEVSHKRAAKAAKKLLEKIISFHGIDGYTDS